MYRPMHAVAGGALLVLIAGCSVSQGKHPSSTDKGNDTVSSRSICGGLLGGTGSHALSKLTTSGQVAPISDHGAKELNQVTSQMRAQARRGDSDQEHNLSSICIFKAPPHAKDLLHSRIMDFKFGWSKPPRESEKVHAYYSTGSALLDVHFGEESTDTALYFTCKTSSGKSGVVEGDASWGWLNDMKLDEQIKEYTRIVNTVGSKVSDSLHCTNNPAMPSTAHVKKLGKSGPDVPTGSPIPSPPESGNLRH